MPVLLHIKCLLCTHDNHTICKIKCLMKLQKIIPRRRRPSPAGRDRRPPPPPRAAPPPLALHALDSAGARTLTRLVSSSQCQIHPILHADIDNRRRRRPRRVSREMLEVRVWPRRANTVTPTPTRTPAPTPTPVPRRAAEVAVGT